MKPRETERWVDCGAARRVYNAALEKDRHLKKKLADVGLGGGHLSRILGKEGKRYQLIWLVNIVKFAEVCSVKVEEVVVGGDGLVAPDEDMDGTTRTNLSSAGVLRGAIRGGPSSDGKAGISSVPLKSPLGHQVERLFRRIAGYWELYHYSFTKTKRQEISLALLHIEETADGLIRCEVYDHVKEIGGRVPEINDEMPELKCEGWCLEANGFLHFIFQNVEDSELTLCIVHRELQLKAPKLLWGILLTTNGVGKAKDPTAGKVALRLLGRTARDAVKKSIIDMDRIEQVAVTSEEWLLKTYVGGYLEDHLDDEGQN
jgi:hypothetical protein